MSLVKVFLIVAVCAPGLLCKPNGNIQPNYEQREYNKDGWNIQESLESYSAPGQKSRSSQGNIGSSYAQSSDQGFGNFNQDFSLGQNPGLRSSKSNPGTQDFNIGQNPGTGLSKSNPGTEDFNMGQNPGTGSSKSNPGVQDFNMGQNPGTGSSKSNPGTQDFNMGQNPGPGSLNPNPGTQNFNFGQNPGQAPSIPNQGPQGINPGEISWGPFSVQFNWNNFPKPRTWDTDPFEKTFPIDQIITFKSAIPFVTPRPWNTDPFEKTLPIGPTFNFPAPLNEYQNYNMRGSYNTNSDDTKAGNPPGTSYNTNVVVNHQQSHERYGNL